VTQAALVGGQKYGDSGDIVGLAESAECGARHHVLLEIAADDTGGVGALGLHPARRDGVDADLAGMGPVRPSTGWSRTRRSHPISR
jgi:hypothetical protein